MNEAVIKLLEKHDYLVKVVIDGSLCMLSMPDSKLSENHFLGDAAAREITYLLDYKDPNMLHVIQDGETDSFEIPAYSMRLAVLLDLWRRCEIIGYDKKYIRYFNRNNEATMCDITQLDPSPYDEDGEKEQNLSMIVASLGLKANDEELEKIEAEYGVGKGYKVLRTFVFRGDENDE